MRKYHDEFKREAVRKIHDGQSVASVARELGCAESLLHRWKRDTLELSSDSEREVLTLRKRVRERVFLKRGLGNSAPSGHTNSGERFRPPPS